MGSSMGGAGTRRIRYQVAASLDGYISGPSGEIDWITPEPSFDFAAHFAQFDTFLMGRRTYETMPEGEGFGEGTRTLVFSRTLRQEDHPEVEVVSGGARERLRALRSEPGKDIWLFGGGELLRSLLELGEVDTVEVAIIPVLLGGGVPLLAGPGRQTSLKLQRHEIYPSGMIVLDYAVLR